MELWVIKEIKYVSSLARVYILYHMSGMHAL